MKITVVLLTLLGVAGSVLAQDSNPAKLASWVALNAPTGYEYLATDLIQSRFTGWDRDRAGNLFKTIGSGNPHRLVACGLDSFAYAVSQVTEQGYLRLHRIGPGSGHPLWDQQHEGQQLRILTREGPLIGVTAVANGHFASQHRNETAIVTQDDLWLDVGASSAAEVAGMGIQLLDPVVRNIPAWFYAEEVAGSNAGSRIGCAAVAAAAEAGINGNEGRTTYVLSAQFTLGGIGVGAAVRFQAPVDELLLIGAGEATARQQSGARINARLNAVLETVGVSTVTTMAVRVADPGAVMERVELSAAEELLTNLVRTVNPLATAPDWIGVPSPSAALNDDQTRWGDYQDVSHLMEIEATLDQLAELSAVPGHEGPIRHVVYNALPDWARDIARVDDMGNLWVEMGPASEATVFIAHMDEVGWEVESIEANGTVKLIRLGGVVTTAWEGQPALLQLDPNVNADSLPEAPQLRGVFLTRESPGLKQPESVSAWFGMNAQQLAIAGVRPGMGVTGYKEGHRMGSFRYASRSLDDRAGTTALLMAIQQIDPSELDQRVIFAWSVREEGGLRGAGALAQRFGTSSRRVYSIDTFVSSDTPLESPHFAFAPLGNGPVLRSIENSGLAIPYELDRNRRVAAEAGIDVQIGLTQGSTDGTAFTFFGAPNAGLSWPGRYSHSPAEIADLRDIAGLIQLIQAMAMAPSDEP